MNWFRNFMKGRAGTDQLSMAILLISILLTWAGRLSGLSVVSMTGTAALMLGFFRIFSKDVHRRRQENLQFMAKIRPLVNRWRPQGSKLRDLWPSKGTPFGKKKPEAKNSKTHHIFRCAGCGKQLRVPRGRGKIRITCPVCRTKIIKEDQ